MARTKKAAFPAEEDPAVHERFRAAMRQVITLETRERHGIGMQKEKTLHAVLKCFKEPDPDRQEIPIGNYIADIYNREGITEIQTAHLGNLREKLRAFLPLYPVRVVYPIARKKDVIWIDPGTGEELKRNHSTHRGSYYTAFKELYRIRPFLREPGLTLELVLLDMDEYRLQDGWSRDGKRGSHRYDRVPTAYWSSLVLERPEDYMQLVPADLPEPFTAAELARAAGFPKALSSTVLLILTEMGCTVRTGKRGRAYEYRTATF